MKKAICGIGINDSDHAISRKTKSGNKICSYYITWSGMIRRCYDQHTHARQPTYIGCSVCDEWHSFVAFKSWMQKQDWLNKHLDKDIILLDNKIYSPTTCAFVSSEVNNLLVGCKMHKGDFSYGVCFDRGKYKSGIRINGRSKHLGRFASEAEAHKAWQCAKADYIEHISNNQADERVKAGLMLRVYKLRDDLANGRDTINL